MPITVNGSAEELPDDPRVSLLDYLRERLQLYGTKKGCDQGACGACTVLVDGERILRVFANVNPHGAPRVWRVGEPFEQIAKRFLPHIKPQLPGAAWLLERLHITKSRRTEYDHLMLHLHDCMKADLDYQKSSPQETMPFPPGSVWVCFSDQTSHAVMSGQFMVEQTFFLPVRAMAEPECAPLGILERLKSRALV